MLSVPLKPTVHMTARSLAVKTGATTVITLDAENQQFVGWTPDAPDDGFSIEGGKGYILNLPKARDVVFTGTAWTNQMQVPAAPLATTPYQTWAFVVSGHLEGLQQFNDYLVTVRNLRTNTVIEAQVRGNYFAAATADLTRRSVVQVGDVMEVQVIGPDGNVESDTRSYKATPESIADAVLSIRLDSIGKPKLTQLLQNFPNPFNPETWIPYQLEKSAEVSFQIYDTTGGYRADYRSRFQTARVLYDPHHGGLTGMDGTTWVSRSHPALGTSTACRPLNFQRHERCSS